MGKAADDMKNSAQPGALMGALPVWELMTAHTGNRAKERRFLQSTRLL